LKANGIEYYSENATHFNTEMLRTFVDRYCRQDGVLLSVEIKLILCFSYCSVIFRLRIITANMNNVIVGELICALWDHWQTQQQTRINTISQHTNHQKAKVFGIHDDRYILLSPRS
jgi:hypothetical protein